MTSHIKLYGSKSVRFENIKAALTHSLGYEPSNPEVVGLLMANYDPKLGDSTKARGQSSSTSPALEPFADGHGSED